MTYWAIESSWNNFNWKGPMYGKDSVWFPNVRPRDQRNIRFYAGDEIKIIITKDLIDFGGVKI